MKCLWHYEWVKLPRNIAQKGKGVLSEWVKLASCAAFRKGTSLYCGYANAVIPGFLNFMIYQKNIEIRPVFP